MLFLIKLSILQILLGKHYLKNVQWHFDPFQSDFIQETSEDDYLGLNNHPRTLFCVELYPNQNFEKIGHFEGPPWRPQRSSTQRSQSDHCEQRHIISMTNDKVVQVFANSVPLLIIILWNVAS